MCMRAWERCEWFGHTRWWSRLAILEKLRIQAGEQRRLTGRFWRLFCRFVATPISSVNKRLESETRELKTDITDLEKKLHYLETTHKNSVDNIDQILKSGGRA